MAAADLGPWEPLTRDAAAATFDAAPFRWWISGRHALDLHLGRSWRAHEDTDIGVTRSELAQAHEHLAGWDLHVAAAGVLTPWHGQPLAPDLHQNNVWCRTSRSGPWVLDLTIGEGADDHWIYRRDASVQVPWDTAILRTADGIPYLAPELQLLYKSAHPRPKDDIDAAEVIPALDPRRRSFLLDLLGDNHPWGRHAS